MFNYILRMNEYKKISLRLLRFKLSDKLDWHVSEDKFAILLYGWGKKYQKKKSIVSLITNRGWMSLSDAFTFQIYCGYNLL